MRCVCQQYCDDLGVSTFVRIARYMHLPRSHIPAFRGRLDNRKQPHKTQNNCRSGRIRRRPSQRPCSPCRRQQVPRDSSSRDPRTVPFQRRDWRLSRSGGATMGRPSVDSGVRLAFRQMGAILKKNALLKLADWRQTIAEVS